MNFKNLVDSSSFNDIWKAFIEIYPHYSQHDLEYANVYNSLLGLSPSENDGSMTINIELIEEDSNHIEYHVYGTNNSTEWSGRWGLADSSWERWLGYYISENALREFKSCVIVALCLWEMTWNGFNQHQIKEKISRLEQKIEDFHKWNDYERLLLDGTIKINDQIIDYILMEYKESESSNIESLVIHLLKADYMTAEHVNKIQQGFDNKEVNRQANASLVRLKIDSEELIDEKDVKMLMDNKLFSTVDYALDRNAITDKAIDVLQRPNEGESFRKVKEKLFLKAEKLRESKGLQDI